MLTVLRCCPFVLVTAWPLTAATQPGPAAPSAILVAGTLGFLGHGTFGDFVGSTRSVSGEFEGELASLRGWVEAPVATLDTQNERRDRDLRAAMEVDRHPTVRLDVAGATLVTSGETRSDTRALLLHGRLAIHGVTRRVDLPVVVTRIADTTHVAAVFPLDLADYHIDGLRKMFGLLRMRRTIEVRVDLRFVNVGPGRRPDGPRAGPHTLRPLRLGAVQPSSLRRRHDGCRPARLPSEERATVLADVLRGRSRDAS